ncbi:MAG: type I secretion C-terminal target domain-containing protein, partial [Pseudomonadales bacterium]
IKQLDKGERKTFSFKYTISDDQGGTDIASASFTVEGSAGIKALKKSAAVSQFGDALVNQDESDRDIFVFEALQNDSESPQLDVITNFDQADGDTLDLSDILQFDARDPQNNLDRYLRFEQTGSATKVMINSEGLFDSDTQGGKVEQVITLENTNLVGNFDSDQAVIDHLLDNNMLIVTDA